MGEGRLVTGLLVSADIVLHESDSQESWRLVYCFRDGEEQVQERKGFLSWEALQVLTPLQVSVHTGDFLDHRHSCSWWHEHPWSRVFPTPSFSGRCSIFSASERQCGPSLALFSTFAASLWLTPGHTQQVGVCVSCCLLQAARWAGRGWPHKTAPPDADCKFEVPKTTLSFHRSQKDPQHRELSSAQLRFIMAKATIQSSQGKRCGGRSPQDGPTVLPRGARMASQNGRVT